MHRTPPSTEAGRLHRSNGKRCAFRTSGNLPLSEAFDPDCYVALAGLSQIIGGLHSQPKVGLSTQSSFQTQSHVGSDCRSAADDAMELLTRDAKACGCTRHREP